MTAIGSILLADDEETFRESTCRLLAREGFECQCTRDADETIECLRKSRFDLLIADIRMPHNSELQLVQEARALDDQMPVILVTGYPSAETAIRSLEMSVVAYLTKPLDFGDLMMRVRSAVEQSQNRRALASICERLRSCMSTLEEAQAKRLPRKDEADELVSMATVRMLASCLSELLEMAVWLGKWRGSQNICELLDCPQEPVHRQAIVKTIEVLKKTKDTFKSKTLADLREELEALIGDPKASHCRR